MFHKAKEHLNSIKKYRLTPGTFLRLSFLILAFAAIFGIYEYFFSRDSMKDDLASQNVTNENAIHNFFAMPAYGITVGKEKLEFESGEGGIKMNLPQNYGNPIEAAFEGEKSVKIFDQNASGFSGVSLLSGLGRGFDKAENKYAKYESKDGRKTVYYSYQKDAKNGQKKLKNWIVYKSGEGVEKESYKIENAVLSPYQNGSIAVYYSDKSTDEGEKKSGNPERTAKIPDLVIDRPYYFDKDGKNYDLDWKIDSGKNEISFEFRIAKDQYPVTLDPTIKHNTESHFDAGEALNRAESISGPKVQSAYRELPADKYTAGLWHMNETANGSCSGGEDACDSSGNGRHGTATGTTIETSSQKLGVGARSFNGTSDYISFGTIPTTVIDNWTLEAWINPSSINQLGMAVSNGYDDGLTGNGYAFGIGNGSGSAGAKLQGVLSGVGWIDSGYTFPAANQWYYVVMERENGTISFYVDGVKTANNSTAIPTAPTQFRIGSQTSSRFFAGKIDEVRISDVARTPEEIRANADKFSYSVYNSSVMDLGVGATSLSKINWTENGVATGDGETLKDNTDLVAQWDFNETSGTAADNSGIGVTYPASASGGAITYSGDYTIHTFLSSGTFTVNAPMDVEALVVAGGGGGGGGNTTWGYEAGAGGAGGVLSSASLAVTAQAYDVTVGDGGAGKVAINNTNPGDNGENSVFSTLTAIGGGGGASGGGAGSNGGSGGGAAYGSSNPAGSGTAGQGYAGGNPTYGGGGGGAGEAGDTDGTGYGGDGIASSISGASTYYGGGGAGTQQFVSTYGGLGGGADNSKDIYLGEDATSNTGGGGGAGHGNLTTGGDGGSGIVIIRYSTYTGGSCTNCDGTLSNFIDTSGQDIGSTAPSGWTSDSRRWGAGALIFDGTNDYVNAGTSAYLDQSGASAFSIETWFRTSYGGTAVQTLVSKQKIGSPYAGFQLGMNIVAGTEPDIGKVGFAIVDSTSTIIRRQTAEKFNDGQWHHAVAAYDGSKTRAGIIIYVDGLAQPLSADTDSASFSGSASNTANFQIGARDGTNQPFSGIIDSTRIYSRALSAEEILSNYNPGNIEFQTRTGATPSSDDGTWEMWKSAGTEAQIDSLDSGVPANDNYSKLLLHMNGQNNSTAVVDSGQIAKTVTVSGNAKISTAQSKFGGSSLYFDGANDWLTIASSNDFSFDGDYTVDMWVYKAGTDEYTLLDTRTSGAQLSLSMNAYATGSLGVYLHPNAYAGGSIPASEWTHVAVARTGSIGTLFINGIVAGTYPHAVPGNGGSNMRIGANVDGNYDFNGYIDELRITKGKARWTSNFTPPTDEYQSNIYLSSDANIKIEGTDSEKIEFGQVQTDSYTTGLWHLDETNTGIGATAYDSSGNGNHGRLSGTAPGPGLADGISLKGKTFNGTSDYIDLGAGSSLNASSVTLEAWVKFDSFSGNNTIIGKRDASLVEANYALRTTGSELDFLFSASSNWHVYRTSGANLIAGKWYYVVVTYEGNGVSYPKIYLDGTLLSGSCVLNTCKVSMTADNNNASIGRPGSYSSEYFSGAIDEVRISNVARSANEIAESYRAGRDYRISRTVSSADLSSKNKIPFYVAADRPGTYLEAAAGESAFANYEPDENTAVLWHLDEESGSGSYIKDSSERGNSGTLGSGSSAPAFVQGKIGKARSFSSASNQYISSGNTVPLANSSFSVDFWSKRASSGASHIVVTQGSASSNAGLHIGFKDTNVFTCAFFSNDLNTAGTFTDSDWHHWACTFDSSTKARKIYRDGALAASDTASANYTGSGSVYVGKASFSAGWSYNGIIDEVRISNSVRTASEIRQAHEVGRRTHPITIDFAASLDSGNLISGTADTSFTINSQTYGAQNKGDNLYAGDKIIIRENYSGTEYMAQGTVASVNNSTGAVTVASWDSGSAAPSGGYTTGAVLFKWQREYWDITGPLDDQINAVTKLTLRQTDGKERRTIYLDDFKSVGSYLTDPSATGNIASTPNRYFQYRSIFSATDANVSPYLSGVSTYYADEYGDRNVYRGRGNFQMRGNTKAR